MALHPSRFTGQDRLQPGARGETFQTDIPGYRNQGDRVNRTNNKLAVGPHDVPATEYTFDKRLPVLFRYGFAYGYNQVVIPKGRVVALDPHMDLVDWDTRKQRNTLTLANGGAPVRLRQAGDLYKAGGSATGLIGTEKKGAEVEHIAKEWIPINGMEAAYTDICFRPFRDDTGAFEGPVSQLTAKGYSVSTTNGKIIDTATGVEVAVRPGNAPIGLLQRNEYTRYDDAYNGMMPGPVLTDALVELPWFAYKNKAEQNVWGSAYGGLFPGCLVKSDENGRLTASPLSFETELATMQLPEYELERQQVIGQVYEVNTELVPAGAAKWATWTLEERMNFESFNPLLYRQNNRDGEDAINTSPFASNGQYPGYPYEKAFKNADLHMLGSAGRLDNYDARMNPQYQYQNLGIPGLTDGYNVAVRQFDPFRAGYMHYAGGKDYVEMFFRIPEFSVQDMQISVGGTAFAPCVKDAVVEAGGQQFLKVKYASEKQGIIVLEVTDKAKADAVLSAAAGKKLDVVFKYSKRGLSGVPTFMDWDGVIGSVKVLLTK